MSGELRRRILEREGTKKDIEKGVANFIFLGLTALMAVLGAFTSDLWRFHGGLAVSVWAVVVVLYIAFWWRANPSNQSLMSLAAENENLERQIASLTRDRDELEQSINLLSYQSAFSLSTRGMLIEYMRRELTSLDDLKEAISELAAPIYLEGEEIFGLGGSERWNFAVYLYSPSRDLLVPVWRMTSYSHPSSDREGRSWGRGQGHVGKAFVDGEAIITPDALHPDVERFSGAPKGMERGYDRSIYRSFASVPIGPISEDEGFPYGVLVGTSDRVGRFDKENTAMLVHLADVLASLIAGAKVEIDALKPIESDSVTVSEQEAAGGIARENA